MIGHEPVRNQFVTVITVAGLIETVSGANLGKECETVEFEDDLGQSEEGLRSLSAMLNRHNHGTVYFGVDNQGEITGLDAGKDAYESLRSLVRIRIQPRIVPLVSEHVTYDGRRYISLQASGYNTPYSYDGRYYMRDSSSDEGIGPETISQLVMAREVDPLNGLKSDKQNLTFRLLFGMMSMRGLHPDADLDSLKALGMIDSHGGFNLTAYLLSDKNGIPMQVVRFNGCDRTSMSNRMNFGGQSLAGSLRAVLEHVSSYMVTKVDLSKGERAETYLFDFESFREAWINACVHNAWWALVPPSVMIFDDRIEVVSYGAVPFPMSLESFYEGDSRPVNRALFDMFSLLGMTEQSGHGVPTIVHNYGRSAFDITDNGVTVTIPFAFEPDYVAARRETSLNLLGLDEKHKEVLVYLSKNPEAKLSETAEHVGISLSSVKKMVSELKADGLLKNEGTNRNSRWLVLR